MFEIRITRLHIFPFVQFCLEATPGMIEGYFLLFNAWGSFLMMLTDHALLRLKSGYLYAKAGAPMQLLALSGLIQSLFIFFTYFYLLAYLLTYFYFLEGPPLTVLKGLLLAWCSEVTLQSLVGPYMVPDSGSSVHKPC